MSRVPLNDIARWTAAHRDSILAAVDRVVTSGWFVLGAEVAAFEAEFAAYCGVGHCVSVGNGTDALEIAVRALGCGPGDEVITAANAGMYAAAAIALAGARPVFADILRDGMTLDPEAVAAAIGPRTRAVVATHLYGRLAEMPALLAVAGRHGIPVIEDCAQAHGAERDGRRAGSWGTLACFSFYPTKNLGALGDGGALTTNDAGLAERVGMLRQYGWKPRYHAAVAGGRNSRLDEIQAAILRLKLPRLDAANARRRAIVDAYRAGLRDLSPFLPAPILPDTTGTDHVAHLCVAVVERRDAVRERLDRSGVDTAVHYPILDHRQPAMAAPGADAGRLPVAEAMVDRILTLPCFPEMTEAEVAHVAVSLRQAVSDAHA